MNEDLIEKIADFMHDQWSHWEKYKWSLKTDYSDNNNEITIYWKSLDYERWRRQMNTPYSELSEKEKDSDREWARKLIELLDL